MTPEKFHTGLREDDFKDAVTVERLPGYHLGEHVHPFDARALITRGAITLTVAGVQTRYDVGDVFHLPADTVHLDAQGRMA